LNCPRAMRTSSTRSARVGGRDERRQPRDRGRQVGAAPDDVDRLDVDPVCRFTTADRPGDSGWDGVVRAQARPGLMEGDPPQARGNPRRVAGVAGYSPVTHQGGRPRPLRTLLDEAAGSPPPWGWDGARPLSRSGRNQTEDRCRRPAPTAISFLPAGSRRRPRQYGSLCRRAPAFPRADQQFPKQL
jgi:hypothetical protein